jgi:hypothetical protein
MITVDRKGGFDKDICRNSFEFYVSYAIGKGTAMLGDWCWGLLVPIYFGVPYAWKWIKKLW